MGQITLTELNYMEGARYLGYGTGTPDDRVKAMMEDCSRQICSQANPRFVYRIFELTKWTDDRTRRYDAAPFGKFHPGTFRRLRTCHLIVCDSV